MPRLEAADEEAGGSCLESGVSYVIGWESTSGFLQLLLNWKPGQNQGSHQLPVKSWFFGTHCPGLLLDPHWGFLQGQLRRAGGLGRCTLWVQPLFSGHSPFVYSVT